MKTMGRREKRVEKQWDDGKRELKTMGRREERVENNGTTGRES